MDEFARNFGSFFDSLAPLLKAAFVFLLVLLSKDAFENIVSGILFIAGKRINIDMLCYYKGREAKINHVGPFRTALFMFDTHSMLYVPNSTIRKLEIEVPADRNIFNKRRENKSIVQMLEELTNDVKNLRKELDNVKSGKSA